MQQGVQAKRLASKLLAQEQAALTSEADIAVAITRSAASAETGAVKRVHVDEESSTSSSLLVGSVPQTQVSFFAEKPSLAQGDMKDASRRQADQ